MSPVDLVLRDAAGTTVWRIGRAPDPWAWTDPRYAGGNRWDDANGVFRTVYAGDSLYACYVEVLAYARPDREPDGRDLLDAVEEDPEDAATFPTPQAGTLPRDWISARMVGSASLVGAYVDVRESSTIAALRPTFLDLALRLGFADFDAAAVKSAYPRDLTQHIATHVYALTRPNGQGSADGVHFASRHGDDLTLWAVFERPGDEPASHNLSDVATRLVDPAESDLRRAMALHGLKWKHE